MSTEVDLVEAIAKLETLRALRKAIGQERLTLHRVLANIARSELIGDLIETPSGN
jgi:hypothetical protein